MNRFFKDGRAKKWSLACMDCGASVNSGSKRCRQCYRWSKIAIRPACICPQCGKSFIREAARVRYCSPQCVPKWQKGYTPYNKGTAAPWARKWTAYNAIIADLKGEIKWQKQHSEEHHWDVHPELMRWRYRIRARHAHRNSRGQKTSYYFAKILRSRVYHVLKGVKKSAPTLALLGCSLSQFRAHLQSQFKRGMHWNNYGKRWHIDHIVPCYSFDLSKPEQQRKCFHYSNLRPLWAELNLKKRALIEPCQPEFTFLIHEKS